MKLDSSRPPSRYAKYVRLATAGGAENVRVMPAGRVIASDWVRFKCQFGCSGWNRRLCCPPYTPTPEQTRRMLKDYRHALIYSHRVPRPDGNRTQRKMQRLLGELERAAFLDGFYRAFGFGAGPCRLCVTCNPKEPCRYPRQARPAMEACGIDVYATSRSAGIELNVATRPDQSSQHVNLLLIE